MPPTPEKSRRQLRSAWRRGSSGCRELLRCDFQQPRQRPSLRRLIPTIPWSPDPISSKLLGSGTVEVVTCNWLTSTSPEPEVMMSDPELCAFMSAYRLRILVDVKSLLEVKVMHTPKAWQTLPVSLV